MSAPKPVLLRVGVLIFVCKCREFGAPHAYLLLDRKLQPEPASFSLQLMLTHLSCLVEWATDREADITPDPEMILHAIQHVELPPESARDEDVFEALKENGGAAESFACEVAKRRAFEFHNAAMKLAS